MTNHLAVEMKGITKTFGDIRANDSVDLKITKGTIHAIIGENGAGKSTLMNILYGMYHPDSGTIYINGNETVIHSPADAIKLGIGMVHQHFMLVNTLTVLENIILGDEVTGALNTIDKRRSRQKVKQILNNFDINIGLEEITGTLSIGTQQKIEIIKLLYRNAEILILDEPTAVLTPQETDELFKTLKVLKAEGKTILLITHKLNEVLGISEFITVLRNGKVTGNTETKDTDKDQLAGMILGGSFESIKRKQNSPAEEVIFEIIGVSVRSDKGLPAVKDLSFEVHRGEIIGIAGVEGNGQHELIEAICGLRDYSGSFILNGKPAGKDLPVAHIPANRHKHGIVMEYNLAENVLLGREGEAEFSTGVSINEKALRHYTERLIKKYDIRPAEADLLIGGLSGGNQQKVVAAREMSKHTDLIVVSHPTRGLDIKAADFVHSVLLEESAKGKGIILVSSDLGELLKLSDRIAVMFNGKINAMLDSATTNEREIGSYMLGLSGSGGDKR